MRPYLEKPFTKIGLVEWLKVKALSSSPSTTPKKLISGVWWCMLVTLATWEALSRMIVVQAKTPDPIQKNN
jgi:hypothetical protein